MRKTLSIILVILSFAQYSVGQKKEGSKIPPKDWFLADPTKDKLLGTSTEKAYNTILKDKKSQTVTVAVIDTGVDIHHEDLKDFIWTNEDEIPNNGIDDDNNGYVDDIHGWNFIGGPEEDIYYELYEYARIYRNLRKVFEDNNSTIDTLNNPEYELYKKTKHLYETEFQEAERNYNYFDIIIHNQKVYSTILKRQLGKDSLTLADVKKITPNDSITFRAKEFLLLINKYYNTIYNEFQETLDYYQDKLYNLDIDADYRSVVNDDPSDPTETGYGNNNIIGPDPDHGTHVSGIIAANRKNDLGIKGIADNILIMPIRAIPEGDEYDKDVANAIRYAVDNGAEIINMSFGKEYSPNKFAVDDAARYAESKGVLIVHGAGNENMNIDSVTHYPTRILNDGNEISTWIEVGASAAYDDKNFASDFSNFGKKSVDVFAPGVEIHSTVPGDKYDNHDGTSMAAPMVTGLAALLKSYYPEFTASQIKEIILKSSKDYSSMKVYIPDTKEVILFGELSKTGGLINVYEAVKMAESLIIKSDK